MEKLPSSAILGVQAHVKQMRLQPSKARKWRRWAPMQRVSILHARNAVTWLCIRQTSRGSEAQSADTAIVLQGFLWL